MKANELMVNDLCFYGKKKKKVVKIRTISAHTGQALLDNGIVVNINEDLTPITTTEEFLEKNFPNAESGVIWWWDIDELYCEIDANNGIKVTGYFHNIHELQHALRLCGINKELSF